MPGGPQDVTRCGRAPITARSHTRAEDEQLVVAADERSRDVGGCADGSSGSTTSHAATGSRFPFASIGGSASNANA